MKKSELKQLIKESIRQILKEEIKEFKGKRYRKQPNGKWVEVSELGKSKEEHEWAAHLADREERSSRATQKDLDRGRFSDIKQWNNDYAKKLSDKEYSDEELGEEKPERHPDFDKYYNEYLDGDKNPTKKDRNDAARYAHNKINNIN